MACSNFAELKIDLNYFGNCVPPKNTQTVFIEEIRYVLKMSNAK